jgi:hypothetical protein
MSDVIEEVILPQIARHEDGHGAAQLQSNWK